MQKRSLENDLREVRESSVPVPPRIPELQEAVNRALRGQFRVKPEGRINRAMSLAMSAPGKRLRPVATLLAGETLGASRSRLLPFAMAVEIVHTASLLLDDLPCMDDAELRRGQPALHHQIGEADTLLTAFALQARAFQLCASVPEMGRGERQLPVRLVQLLERAVGAEGMCEGQSLDLAFEPDEKLGIEALEGIHRRKTGALFAAALQGGGRLAGAHEEELAALFLFGKNLGLAFQVADDLLDHRGDPKKMGKASGADRGRRLTFVSLFGEAASEAALRDLHKAACDALAPLGKRAKALLEFADFLEKRDA